MQLKFNSVSFCQNGDTLLGPIDFETKIRGITNVLGYNGASTIISKNICNSPNFRFEINWTKQGIAILTKGNRIKFQLHYRNAL